VATSPVHSPPDTPIEHPMSDRPTPRSSPTRNASWPSSNPSFRGSAGGGMARLRSPCRNSTPTSCYPTPTGRRARCTALPAMSVSAKAMSSLPASTPLSIIRAIWRAAPNQAFAPVARSWPRSGLIASQSPDALRPGAPADISGAVGSPGQPTTRRRRSRPALRGRTAPGLATRRPAGNAHRCWPSTSRSRVGRPFIGAVQVAQIALALVGTGASAISISRIFCPADRTNLRRNFSFTRKRFHADRPRLTLALGLVCIRANGSLRGDGTRNLWNASLSKLTGSACKTVGV
jgi:hypothetical protein